MAKSKRSKFPKRVSPSKGRGAGDGGDQKAPTESRPTRQHYNFASEGLKS